LVRLKQRPHVTKLTNLVRFFDPSDSRRAFQHGFIVGRTGEVEAEAAYPLFKVFACHQRDRMPGGLQTLAERDEGLNVASCTKGDHDDLHQSSSKWVSTQAA